MLGARALVVLCFMIGGCRRDDHPEFSSAIVASTSIGRVFVVIDHMYDEDSDGEVTLSENSLRRIDVETGEDSGRLGIDGAGTDCAPATMDHIWCNSNGTHSIRRIETMRAIVDNGDLNVASDGRFDLEVRMLGLRITPWAHELVGSYWDEGLSDTAHYAIHPDGLVTRMFDPSVEEEVTNVDTSNWGAESAEYGAYRYSIGTHLARRVIDDPSSVYVPLNLAQTYEEASLLIRSVFDSREEPMVALDPYSVFVFERPETEFRLSRVSMDDGAIVWTHVDRAGWLQAAAISNGTIAFVLSDTYVSEEIERDAVVVGLSLETGNELYRIEVSP